MSLHATPRITFGATVAPYTQVGWPQAAFLPCIPLEKRPGRWIAEEARWVGMTGSGLLKVGLPASDPRVTWDDIQSYPTPALCVRGSVVPALDVDSDAAAVHELVRRLLVVARTERRRTGSERFLVPFRTEEPITRWLPIRFTLPGDERVHALELNAHGQQWVGCGPHPASSTYFWHTQGEGRMPRTWAPELDGLPPADQGWVDELHELLVRNLKALGATFEKDSDRLVKAGQDSERLDPDALEPLLGVETLGRVLAAIPNDRDHVGGWDKAVALLASIRRLLGHDGTVPPDCLAEWIGSFPGGTRDDFLEGRWRSFDHGVSAGRGTFMQWVEEQAPELAPAVASEITRAEVRDVFDVVEGDMGEAPEGLGLRAVANDDGTEGTDDAIEGLLRAFVYREPTGEWIRRRDATLFGRAAFNDSTEGLAATLEDLRQRRVARPDATPRKAHTIAVAAATRVQDLTYLPGHGRLVKAGRRGVLFNQYLAPGRPHMERTITEADVAPFTELMEWLFEDEGERTIMYDWLTFLAQRPGVKIHWAPVLLSETQGVGKDSLLRVVGSIVGQSNFAQVPATALDRPHNDYWALSQVVYVNELPSFRKRDLADKLLGYVAGTGGDLMVDPKNQPIYAVPNTHCWIFTTNKLDALQLDPTDRRYAVFRVREQAMPADMAARLHGFYDANDGEGLELAAEFLRRRQVSATFNHARCPWTEAKDAMKEDALDVPAHALLTRLKEGDWKGRRVLDRRELEELQEDGLRNDMLSRAIEVAGFTVPKCAGRDRRITVGKGEVVKLRVWVRKDDPLVNGTGRAIFDQLVREVEEHSTAIERRVREQAARLAPREVGGAPDTGQTGV